MNLRKTNQTLAGLVGNLADLNSTVKSNMTLKDRVKEKRHLEIYSPKESSAAFMKRAYIKGSSEKVKLYNESLRPVTKPNSLKASSCERSPPVSLKNYKKSFITNEAEVLFYPHNQ